MGDVYSLPEGFENSGPCTFCAERVGGEDGRRGAYWMGTGMHYFCEQCVAEGRLGDLIFDALRSGYSGRMPGLMPGERALEEALAATTARMFKAAYVTASAQCQRAMHAGFQEGT